MKKDDIEKLFSSLEDFSKTPPDDLWGGIEEKLDYPKKKKIAPFWWGIAASLVLGLGLLATFYSNPNKDTIRVPVEHENEVVNQSRSSDTIAKDSSKSKIELEEKTVDNKLSNSNEAVVVQNQKNATRTTRTTNIFNSNSNRISESKNEAVAAILNKNKAVLANNNQNPAQLVETKKVEKEAFVQQNQLVEKEKLKEDKPIEDSKIKENLTETDLKENALAAIAKEQEKKEKIAVVQDKWSLQVFAGINNSQNLKKQKTLGNNIESQKGYNYGVKTNYKLNRRWAVSSGVKISELGQQVANVSYVNSTKNLVNISKAPFGVQQEKGTLFSNPNYLFIPQNHNENNTLASTNSFYEKGDLSQRVQYLEIPMEVSYAILNKGKARVNLNTGGFVGKAISNEVLLDNNSIGKNKAVNDVVFGTVLSSTLQYELFKKTKVFVEPGMNYYTQPVQNQNFNQFQLIFNFGLNVSF
ncbi:MAG: hypothetical protein V4497_12765 [Bacteroidota bacterium]